jgi:hypothetical protein
MRSNSTQIDTAINWSNSKAYILLGNLYIRYDIPSNCADKGYPMSIADNNWAGLGEFAGGIDQAISWGCFPQSNFLSIAQSTGAILKLDRQLSRF